MAETLLLADDSVTIRRVIELTFADERVRVVSVSSGREAIARMEVAADRPDIVLADVGMEDLSGYDISAFIKGRQDLKHIPVILLAGAFEPLDELRARKSGSDAVLVKPFEPQMVVARVRELLERKTAPRPITPVQQASPRQGGRDVDDLTAHEYDGLRAASSGSANTDPLFDESLDRLDAAFGRPGAMNVPGLDESAVSDFAKDLKDLRSSQPETAFERQDFGDWDLPSRTAPEALATDPVDLWTEPVRQPLPEPSPVILPPPVALEPRPAPVAAAPRVAPRPGPPARPSMVPAPPPLADAFSSLLAAEEGRPYQAPPRDESLHAAIAASLPAGTQMTDEAMDKIVDRVLVRLGANVRGTVIDLAERLVRAEIDRLKTLR